MTITSKDLLRTLGAGLSPVGTEKAPAGGPRLIEGQTFDQLLSRARGGEIESGAPIRVESSSGLKFTPEQSVRLARAADHAEAQGAGRAVVLMDGMALTMDVATRTVTGRVDLTKDGALMGIDAVINVPAPDTSGENSSASASALLKALSKPGDAATR